METRVYCNYYGDEGEMIPTFFVLIFDEDEPIDWKQETLKVSVRGPYERLDATEILEGYPAATVYMEDMTVDPDNRTRFGINLPRLYQRIYANGYDPSEIRQLVMLTEIIEEVLSIQLPYNT